MKKKLAVWLHGGIGTGHFSQGYPPLEKLLQELSSTFDVTVYSQYKVNPGYQSSFFTVRSPKTSIKSGAIRWLQLAFYLIRDQRSQKFDLLFAFWGYPAGLLLMCISRIIRRPYALFLLGTDSAGIPSINFGIFNKPVVGRLALWSYGKASLLLAISEFQKEELVRRGLQKKLHVIPWGVEKSFSENIFRTRNATLHFIHVGHLTPVKDQVTLLKAFALIAKQHPAELRILGTDCMEGAIQRASTELGLDGKVTFIDMVPYSEMPDQYAWADIMLHTSLFEGQCMALTEAAACRVLLAGTRVGLLCDLGEDGAILTAIGDAGGLARNVLEILGDQKSWDQKIMHAKRWSDQHDLAWTVGEITSLLNKTIDATKGSS